MRLGLIAATLMLAACGSKGYVKYKQTVEVHETNDGTAAWVVVAEELEAKDADFGKLSRGEKTSAAAPHIYFCVRQPEGKPPRCYAPQWNPAAPIPSLLRKWLPLGEPE